MANGDLAQASVDWTTGHSDFRWCGIAEREPNGSIAGAEAAGAICWSAGRVDVQNSLTADTAADGYCAVGRIRYKINASGDKWSDWHTRNMATACGNGTAASPSIWWSTFVTGSGQMQACLRDGSDGPVIRCSGWY